MQRQDSRMKESADNPGRQQCIINIDESSVFYDYIEFHKQFVDKIRLSMFTMALLNKLEIFFITLQKSH